ncbi:hypothetical protein AVEN_70868-1 [Araneus ventricosus]|uniref:Uncharacterized protein n=1 Tax=Araneus ventricosus TaxID=182803 RepID=A0A4Y2HRR7_ARAVE|nr:hypothetical protein AVEN_70868-1 [Araneus ventricosus]
MEVNGMSPGLPFSTLFFGGPQEYPMHSTSSRLLCFWPRRWRMHWSLPSLLFFYFFVDRWQRSGCEGRRAPPGGDLERAKMAVPSRVESGLGKMPETC